MIIRTPHDKHIQNLHNARMIESFQDLDFPKCSYRHSFLLVMHQDPLQCNNGACGFINGFVHFTVPKDNK